MYTPRQSIAVSTKSCPYDGIPFLSALRPSLRVILTAIKASLALMPLNQITPLVGIPLSQIWGPLV